LICTSIANDKYEVEEQQATKPSDGSKHTKKEQPRTKGKDGNKQSAPNQTTNVDPQATMDHLAKMIDVKHDTLKTLFNAWDENQLDIVALAGEILGLEGVALGDALPAQFEQRLAQAVQTREKQQAVAAEGYKVYDGLETRVRNTLEGIKSEVATIAKVSIPRPVRSLLTLLCRYIKSDSRSCKRSEMQPGKNWRSMRTCSSVGTRSGKAPRWLTDLSLVPGQYNVLAC
jgi:hypothetical protein